jgi:hypothetical protein
MGVDGFTGARITTVVTVFFLFNKDGGRFPHGLTVMYQLQKYRGVLTRRMMVVTSLHDASH